MTKIARAYKKLTDPYIVKNNNGVNLETFNLETAIKGEKIRWDINGGKFQEESYHNGKAVSKFITWKPNSKKKGLWIYYDIDEDKKTCEILYQNGQRVNTTTY